MSFGVFGLGNKQYEHFCAVGKRVHKALGALGGKAFVRRGDGDDDEDIEADFESWRTELYTSLDKSDVLVKTVVRPKLAATPIPDDHSIYELQLSTTLTHASPGTSGEGLIMSAGTAAQGSSWRTQWRRRD